VKKYLGIVIIALIFLCGTAQGSDLTISYGEDTWNESLCSKGVETHALEIDFKTPYNEWLDYGVATNWVWSKTNPGRTINGDAYFGGTDISLILAGRLTAHKKISKRVFVEGFGGFGLMFLDRQPEMGPRHLVGNFGARIGYEFDGWSIVYTIEDHWSVPGYKSDKGHNRHLIGIRIPFSFFSRKEKSNAV